MASGETMSIFGDDPIMSTTRNKSTGAVMAAYVGLRGGVVVRTEEILDGKVFADFDHEGKLIGIEILL
jgi:drug/metabolite transporter superfamily protein YnfA